MKKGWTIIELIISTSLILLIGVVSLVSFNLVKKQEVTNDLASRSEEILTAANLYIETTPEVKNKLYSSKNGVVIPLSVLESKGLVDFEGVNIDEQYVITMLGSEIPGEECVSSYTLKSWEFPNDKIIYICTNETKENSIKQEDKVFRGSNPDNYVKVINGEYESIWRIVEIINGDIKLIGAEDKLLCNTDEVFNDSITSSNYALNYNNVVGNDSFTLDYISKEILKNNNYVIQKTDGTNGSNIPIVDYYSYSAYFAMIDYLSMLNTNASDGNWIYTLLRNFRNTKSYNISIGYADEGYVNSLGCLTSTDDISTSTNQCQSPRYFAPFITLADCVELIKDETCSNTYETGSETCPYLLNTTKCA